MSPICVRLNRSRDFLCDVTQSALLVMVMILACCLSLRSNFYLAPWCCISPVSPYSHNFSPASAAPELRLNFCAPSNFNLRPPGGGRNQCFPDESKIHPSAANLQPLPPSYLSASRTRERSSLRKSKLPPSQLQH